MQVNGRGRARAAGRRTLLAVVVSGALAVSACSGPEREDGQEQETVGAGATAGEEARSTTAADAVPIPDLVPVAWPDAPRVLTEAEKEFMVEPGPYAGDAYDLDAVVEAVRAMRPGSVAEWTRAIRSQIQGDYAADVRTVVTFDADLGDIGAGPTAGAPTAPEGGQEVVGRNHFALLLDASGSMAAPGGDGTKMAEAKAAITDFAASVPEGSTLSLRVYGHEGDNSDAGKAESCASSEVVHEGPADPDALAQALEDVRPVGFTPLARAISDAADDVPAEATDGIVYVVTDGIESCGGDPVAAAEELADSGVRPVVNVIGFRVEDSDQEALAAIAEAGGGEFTEVGSGSDLEGYWAQEHDRMVLAWREWRNAELDRLVEEANARLDEVRETAGRLVRGAQDEGSRGHDVVQRLRSLGDLDAATAGELSTYFTDRRALMWDWAQQAKVAGWDAVQAEKTADWDEIYQRSTDGWLEHYARGRGR